MIRIPDMQDRLVAVMGLGKSGIVAAQALAASGARVAAWDDDPANRATADLPLADPAKLDWTEVSALVLSPGIPHAFPAPHPVAALAMQSKTPIVCDIDLLARAQPAARYVGVTGTNGKSTTTALVAHVLDCAGWRHAVGGNLGPPALSLEPLGEDGTYVLELSSYQLERVPSLICDVAVLLNISPDHLDRHGGIDGYVAAKMRIFQNQQAGHTAIVGIDDAHSRAVYDSLEAGDEQSLIPIAVGREAGGGVYVVDGGLIDDLAGEGTPVMDLTALVHLPGRHNWQNAAAAYAAARALGIADAIITDAIGSFPGLPHRQERVAVVNGIPFINDSKATNADAAKQALACYDDIYWIAGGRAKKGGIAGLAPYFDRIAHAFLIGDSAIAFADQLGNQVPHTLSRTLEAAVRDAHLKATADGRPNAVVLLSPAAASFDQFANFETRGDAFRAIVDDIARGTP